MNNRWACFEIRVSTRAEDTDNDPREDSKILCAAIAVRDGDDEDSFIFHETTEDGSIGDALSKTICHDLLRTLTRFHGAGYTVVSWNGVGHDLMTLAYNTEQYDECRNLAMRHCDVMFQFHCQAGHPISLRAAANGMKVPLGEHRQQQVDHTQLWEHPMLRELVVQHAALDAATTIEVARRCQEQGEMTWITMRNHVRVLPFPHGLLKAEDAMDLPTPDTSWMADPIPREKFYRWLT